MWPRGDCPKKRRSSGCRILPTPRWRAMESGALQARSGLGPEPSSAGAGSMRFARGGGGLEPMPAWSRNDSAYRLRNSCCIPRCRCRALPVMRVRIGNPATPGVRPLSEERQQYAVRDCGTRRPGDRRQGNRQHLRRDCAARHRRNGSGACRRGWNSSLRRFVRRTSCPTRRVREASGFHL